MSQNRVGEHLLNHFVFLTDLIMQATILKIVLGLGLLRGASAGHCHTSTFGTQSRCLAMPTGVRSRPLRIV